MIAICMIVLLPQFIDAPRRCYFAAIKMELKRFHQYQEKYYIEHHQFSSTLESLGFNNQQSANLRITWADEECYLVEGYSNKYFDEYFLMDCTGKMVEMTGTGNNNFRQYK